MEPPVVKTLRNVPLVYHGPLTLEINGRAVTFDLSKPHEGRYALQALTGLAYPQSDIDTALFSMFVREGDVCLDMGANIGMAALDMLGCGAQQVIAFEPVEALRKRLYSLDEPRLQIYAAAVSDKVGLADITLSQTHNQGHSLDKATVDRFPDVFGDDLRTERVVTISLDRFFKGKPSGDVWKIDVEGAEHAAFRGARQLLKKSPPRVILCECYEGVEELFALLGPGWSGLRAHMTLETNRLEFTALTVPLDETAFSSISPTYVFFRDAEDVLPSDIVMRA
jgi:FkbM family methyltransferase